MLDCTTMTWEQMSEVVFAIREEAKRRNPIGINCYVPFLQAAEEALTEIADGERDNPTSEAGPTVGSEE